MEFDRPLAMVQGCLLAPRPAPDTSVPDVKPPTQTSLLPMKPAPTPTSLLPTPTSLLPKLLSVLRELDLLNLGNVDDINRRVHLFLLINTKLGWTCDLINNDGFSSLVDIMPPLDPSLYIEAVLRRNLWPHLIETLQHLPLDECRRVWGLATQCLVENVEGVEVAEWMATHQAGVEVAEWMATLTGVTCAAITAASKTKETLAAKQIIKSALKVFAENLLKPAYVEDKCVIMVNVLMVLRMLLDLASHKQTFKIVQISEEAQKLYCFTKNTEPVDVNLVEEVDVVLAVFKTLVVAFSIDTWMDWCEISSDKVLPHVDRVLYWSDDQPPSNMQLLIAHLMAQARKSLLDAEHKTNLAAEMVNVMGSYANEYDRKVELNMDELELEELMEKVRIHDGWKQKAYVDHIVKEDLKKSLEDQTYVDYLVKNPALVSEQTENIIKTLVDRDVNENQKILIDKLILTLSEDAALDILKWYVSKHGLESKLRTSGFDQTLVSCLNKAVSTDKDTNLDVIQFLSLALQDPRDTVVELVLQAANNKGKVDLVAKVLLELNVVCCFTVEDRSLLSSLLFEHLESTTSTPAGKQNCFQVLIKVAGAHPNYGVEVMRGLVPSLWKEFSGGNCVKSVEVAQYIIDLLENTKTLKQLENVDVERLVGVLVSVLNVVVHIGRIDVANICALRELCLLMLNIIFKNSPDFRTTFESAFNARSRGYFYSGESLKMNIQAYYFNPPTNKDICVKKLASLSDDLLSFQVLECLPNLLRTEWLVLYNLLVDINCFKSSHAKEDLEVTLQAEEVDSVSSCLLDSLSILLNNSNLSLDLQKHMVLSLAGVLSQVASSLTLPSCQQLFLHLLTTQLLVPAVVADDLLTCQHSVLAVLLLHDDITKDHLEEVVGHISWQPESEGRAMGLRMVEQWIKDKPGKLLPKI